jgi:transmembrane sensor
MDYQDYTVNDFVDDERFRNYVLRKNATDIAFWTYWIAENPDKYELIAEAEKLLLLFALEATPSVSDAERTEEWQKLWTRIHTVSSENILENVLENDEPILQPIRGGKYKWAWAVAASFALFALIFLLLPKNTSPQYQSVFTTKTDTILPEKETGVTSAVPADDAETIYKTPFGKTQKLTLPDGSTVILNANSKLHFSKNWSKTADRIVWLEGEAEFSVQHYDLPNGGAQKFMVHTEGVKVEVIGTRFNLMSRADKCKLALYEGKVQLHLTKHPEEESIAIAPNEVVQVDNGAVVRIVPIKKVAVYQAWTKQHFEFDDTPLSEVALLVENNYGFKFLFKDNDLKMKRLTASIPDDDVAVLAKVIAQIFNIKTQKNGNEIIFENKN